MESKHARPTVARTVARKGWAATLGIALAASSSGCGSWLKSDPYEEYRQQQEERWEARHDEQLGRQERSIEERVEAADQLRGSGNLDRAVWAYIEAYRRDPHHPIPIERIGFVQLTEDPPRAQITFEKLVEEQPLRATAHTGLGLAYYAQGQLEPARASLERSVELNPESPLTLSGLAAVYDLLGRSDDANAMREKLAAMRPRDPRVANNIGISRMLQGNYVGAEESLQRAVQLDPRDATSWNNLGLVLGYLERYPEALDAFRKSGDEQTAQNNVGYLYYRVGRYDEAIASYEAALLASGDQKARVLQNLQTALDARDDARNSETADGGKPAASPPASDD
jgi:Flp pilus assembly protein TadD